MKVPKKVLLGNNPPWSGVTMFNQEVDWWPSDSEQSFQRMMQDPVHRQYFAEQGWDKPGGITYKFNSFGFRGDEVDWEKPKMFTFGCSFTMGIGLPQHKTWPWVVAQRLGIQVVNFALGGVSADWCFRMAEYWLQHGKPVLAVMLAPPHERVEVITDDERTAVTYSAHETVSDRFLQTWFTYNENRRLNNVKNRLAFLGLCQQLGVPGFCYDAFQWFGRSREEVGYARDYMHAGPKGHEMLADRIIDDWNETRNR